MFLVLGCRRFDSGTADRAADSACAAEGGSSGSSSLLRSMASSLLLPVLSPITDKAESFAARGEGRLRTGGSRPVGLSTVVRKGWQMGNSGVTSSEFLKVSVEPTRQLSICLNTRWSPAVCAVVLSLLSHSHTHTAPPLHMRWRAARATHALALCASGIVGGTPQLTGPCRGARYPAAWR